MKSETIWAFWNDIVVYGSNHYKGILANCKKSQILATFLKIHVKEFLRRYFLKILPRFWDQLFCGTPPNGCFCVEALSSVKDLVIFSERFVLGDINNHILFNNLLVNALETQEIKQKWFNNTLIRSGTRLFPSKSIWLFPLLLIDYLHFQTSKYFLKQTWYS